MKRLAPLIGIALLAGCAGLSAKIDSWKGRSTDDLIRAWGPPSQSENLSDGSRVISYTGGHQISGTTYDCRVWFTSDKAGKITAAEGEGQLGGCNRLLGNKKAAGE